MFLNRIIFISFLLSFIFTLDLQAFDIREVNKSNIVSQAYNVNDTNLVDSENAENILENVKDLNEALSEKEKEIQK